MANRPSVAPPPTRYGGAIIQNRGAGGNLSFAQVPAPPTKFGPVIQAKPAAPAPVTRVVQPAALAIGGALAVGSTLALVRYGVNYLWNDGRLAGKPARIRGRIANTPYLNMRNLNLQQALAGGNRMVRSLAALYVAADRPYGPTRFTEFKAMLDDFEIEERGDWRNILRSAYIANLAMRELSALTPADLAGDTQQLVARVLQLYLGRGFANFVGSLQHNNVLVGLQAARQEVGETLTYLGVPSVDTERTKKALAGPLLRHHWPFLTLTKRLFELAVRDPGGCADELFQQILENSGYRYDSGTAQASELHGSGRGNCQALTYDFAALLSLFSIGSTFTTVEDGDDRHRFIVCCPHFIDRQVRGNIYDGNRLLRDYYVFQNHHALTIGRQIYDVMAGAKYRYLNKIVELVLLNRYQPDEAVLVFRRVGDGTIMSGKNRLVINYGAVGPGRLPRCELFNQGDDCPVLNRRVP